MARTHTLIISSTCGPRKWAPRMRGTLLHHHFEAVGLLRGLARREPVGGLLRPLSAGRDAEMLRPGPVPHGSGEIVIRSRAAGAPRSRTARASHEAVGRPASTRFRPSVDSSIRQRAAVAARSRLNPAYDLLQDSFQPLNSRWYRKHFSPTGAQHRRAIVTFGRDDHGRENADAHEHDRCAHEAPCGACHAEALE